MHLDWLVPLSKGKNEQKIILIMDSLFKVILSSKTANHSLAPASFLIYWTNCLVYRLSENSKKWIPNWHIFSYVYSVQMPETFSSLTDKQNRKYTQFRTWNRCIFGILPLGNRICCLFGLYCFRFGQTTYIWSGHLGAR